MPIPIPVLDLDANNSSGAPDPGYVTTFTENGPAVAIADSDVSITNSSGTIYNATITGGGLEGDLLSVSGTLPDGITASSNGGGGLILSKAGGSSAANFQVALHQIIYSNSSHNPNTSNRTFDIRVTDDPALANGYSNLATATIHVVGVDDAPVAQDGAFHGSEDSTISNTLTATDIDGPSLSYSRVTQAAHGSVTVNGNGSFLYVPNLNFNGTDSFTYKVNDGTLDSNVATVTLTVVAVNDPPVITSNGGGDTATVSVPENTTVVTTVTVSDPDLDNLTYFIVGGADADKFVIESNGTLSFLGVQTPDFEAPRDSDHNNTYLVTVRVSDGAFTDEQAVTVQVTDVADVPPKLHWTASAQIGAHPPGYQISGIGDFNHDSTSDVLWYNQSTRDTDIWSLSNGQWAGSSTIGLHPAGYQIAGVGDFNKDGTSDVLWFNPTTRDTDIWAVSNGHWAGSTTIGVHPAGYDIAGIGDFNNDGTSDVLWFNPTTRDTDIWTVINGHWAASTTIGLHPAGYQIAGIGDFNHDGTSDVLWYNPTTRDTDIWAVNNGHWAGSTTIGVHPAGYQIAGVGDFNNDGTSDVVWYNPSNNDVDVWLVQNGQWAGSAGLGAHPPGSTLVGVGDFDHNGVADIMWRDTSDGHVESWMLAYS